MKFIKSIYQNDVYFTLFFFALFSIAVIGLGRRVYGETIKDQKIIQKELPIFEIKKMQEIKKGEKYSEFEIMKAKKEKSYQYLHAINEKI